MAKVFYDSPIGIIEIVAEDDAVLSADIVEKAGNQASHDETGAGVAHECARQLDEYFNGKRKEFSVKIRPAGTAFQRNVWDILTGIPFGMTDSYGKVAGKSGNPRGARSVGQAVGRNPILIIVPCHRVIASDGGIGGFSSGLWRKEWLLEHERKITGKI